MNDGQYEGASHGGKGSVRRAREMMKAGLPPNVYADVGRGRGPQAPTRLPARQPPPVPAAFSPDEQGVRGPNMAPSQMAPWPLPDDNTGVIEISRYPDDMAPPRPQRPPRPDPRNVPAPLDPSRMQEYTSNTAYNQPPGVMGYQYEDPRAYAQDLTPVSDQTMSPDSFSDPFSSPEFPPDRGYLQRNQYLGPPSARRGANSFYANNPNISPIQEEFPESSPRKPISYASSKVIPSSWGTAPLDGDFPTSSRESLGAHAADDDEGLVRQASVGKRGKPSLRTINKPQNSQTSETEGRRLRPEGRGEDIRFNNADVGAYAVGGMTPNTTDTRSPTGNQQRAFNQNRFSSDSASSEDTLDDLEKLPISKTQILGTLSEKELKELELLNHDNRVVSKSNRSRLDVKRPPPLDIDAVREAEARGSLTSLPDLIRRATKLASNLDRGRTASRLGMLDMLNSGGDANKGRGRNSGSISDILASFPPPGAIGTPTAGSRGSGAYENRANPNAALANTTTEQPTRPQRCCGLSRCAFILIIVVLFLLISSAVIIPVALIVLPREQNSDNPDRPTVSPASCEALHPCLNGGVSIGREPECGCVCVDGFRGPRCSVPGDSSCTIANINSDYQNATVGHALPRLFDQSQSNFSIPLNASRILGLFNQEDLSCTSENALVTFNGSNKRRRLLSYFSDTSDDDYRRYHSRNHVPIARRNDPSLPRETGTVPLNVQPNKPTTSSDGNQPLPAEVIDFARIAVLFIFERTGEFRSATNAHDAIQGLLKIASSDFDIATQMPMDWSYGGHSFALNFRNYTIQLQDGTIVGKTGRDDDKESTRKTSL
ncbi:predicted protein [Uncinocarpus reesii 1704]|uniref:EGF-like domain-containing protein n=1 Tax=Uncinocarpus reesii (strain UAMH 1704) TaxID=336963 RepID=C4JE67_UNCRE|nr:uncharacterized protein UREG_00491 [Uncinocarpus reesii 1704]EEP75645.1 predicted protein [Uncinocarpus reesii 1704]